jgi:uncharacterized membrane protein YheB (UPF0754 family)
MNIWVIILVPLLSAFIGWFTNWMFIKMLFHPREPKKVLGMTFHGVFPKRQKQLAEKLAAVVSREFSFTNIEEKISDPKNLEKIMPTIESHVDEFLRVRLGKEMPMISMFIGDKTINKMKEALMKEIESLFPIVMKQYAGNLKAGLDLEQLVINKVAAFTPGKVEEMFYQGMSKELRLMGITGAIIGFIIGMLQLLIIWLTS